MTDEPFRVLTVCIGNICRSPIAERMLRLRLAEQVSAGAVSIESAGVGAVVGHPVDRLALDELVRLGGSGEGFAARQITGDHMSQADLVVTATADVRARALQADPRALRRTFTLAEFAAVCAAPESPDAESAAALVQFAASHRSLAAGHELDVIDPIGQDAEAHRAVADLIDGYVTVIAARLGAVLGSRSPMLDG